MSHPPPTLPNPGVLHAIRPFLFLDLKHLVLPLPAPSPAVAIASRKLRARSSIVALLSLLSLLSLTVFCSLHQHLNDAPRLTIPTRTVRASRAHAKSQIRRPKLTLSPAEELGAVIAFIAALPANALPASVDPRAPLDPDLVLDFDTRTPRAAREVRRLVADTWARLPVVLLTKRRSPAGREIAARLDAYAPPAVVAVDERADEAVLVPLLRRLTGAADLPVLLVAGKPVGSVDAIRDLDAAGRLRAVLAASGAVVDGERRKGKGKRRMAS